MSYWSWSLSFMRQLGNREESWWLLRCDTVWPPYPKQHHDHISLIPNQTHHFPMASRSSEMQHSIRELVPVMLFGSLTTFYHPVQGGTRNGTESHPSGICKSCHNKALPLCSFMMSLSPLLYSAIPRSSDPYFPLRRSPKDILFKLPKCVPHAITWITVMSLYTFFLLWVSWSDDRSE